MHAPPVHLVHHSPGYIFPHLLQVSPSGSLLFHPGPEFLAQALKESEQEAELERRREESAAGRVCIMEKVGK